MTAEGRRSRSTEAFFGRRRGKAIRPLQAAALEEGLRRYGLDLGSAGARRPQDAVCRGGVRTCASKSASAAASTF